MSSHQRHIVIPLYVDIYHDFAQDMGVSIVSWVTSDILAQCQVKIKRPRAWVILFSVFCKQRWEFNMRVVLVENARSIQSGKNSSSRENECYETISGKSSFRIFWCLAFRTIDTYTRLIENLIIYFQGVYCFLDRVYQSPVQNMDLRGARQKFSVTPHILSRRKINIHIIFHGIRLFGHSMLLWTTFLRLKVQYNNTQIRIYCLQVLSSTDKKEIHFLT